MAQGQFKVGITRDSLRPDGKPIFAESAFRILDDAGIDYEFLPENEPELTPESAAKYDALAVMLAKVTRNTVSGLDCLTDECINTVAASVFSACRDLAKARVPKNVVNEESAGTRTVLSPLVHEQAAASAGLRIKEGRS